MENYNIDEIIEQAIQTEKLGYAFYTRMADKFEKDEKMKELFNTMASKEQEHEKAFIALRENAEEEIFENWAEVSQYLRAIVESEFFLGKDKSLPSMENLQSIEDAVRFAISFEKDTLLYFHSLRDLVHKKEVIDEIIDEERKHIVWLNKFKKELQE